jgi:hypothetical protein
MLVTNTTLYLIQQLGGLGGGDGHVIKTSDVFRVYLGLYEYTVYCGKAGVARLSGG